MVDLLSFSIELCHKRKYYVTFEEAESFYDVQITILEIIKLLKRINVPLILKR